MSRGWTLSVPSYIVPGTYLENVRYLEGLPVIQAVELLFYLYDRDARELLARERAGLAARRGRFSFSVHLPDALEPEHVEILALTRSLSERYILHPPPSGEKDFLRLVRDWRAEHGELFLLENLIGRCFEDLAAAMPDLPLCLDTGHLLRSGSGIRDFLSRHGARVREIHLHGVRQGEDHRPFLATESWLQDLLPFLEHFSGVVNLEVFSRPELDECLRSLAEAGLLDPAGA
jgi:hypothetical protein